AAAGDEAERDTRPERIADDAVATLAIDRLGNRVEVRVPGVEHRAAAVAGQGDRAGPVGQLPRRHDVVPRRGIAAEAVNQRADHRTVAGGATTSLMNSSRVASSRNTPRTPLVTSRASCAPTPRAAMHMC